MSGAHQQDVTTFRETVKQYPSSADAWFNLGKALADAGAYGGAVLAYRRCAELDPADAWVHFNIGNTLHRAGDTEAAITAFRAAVARDDAHAAMFINLGASLEEAGDHAGAADAYQHALRCDPRSAQAFNNLGNCQSAQSLLSRAEESYRAALRLQPDMADAWYNLGGVLARQGRHAEAEVAYRGALRLRPDHSEAYINLAGVVQDLGRSEEAIGLLRYAVAARPSLAEAHFNLGLALLQNGAWEEGWREFDWRTRTVEGRANGRSANATPWDGVVRPGETVLIRAEQGYGDTIQCARFIPALAERGMHVALECRAELHPLFEDWPADIRLTTPERPFSGIDRAIGILSLPGLCRVTPPTIPSAVPYLRAPDGRTAAWRPRVRSAHRLLHVGIVIAGNPAHKNDRNRSMPVSDVLPLFGVQGVAWHTLLQGSDPLCHAFPAGIPVIHHGDAISDFGDSAALLENLDLLISVDTAPAHLGGALGIPVWTMVPFNPDWRWLLGRDDSPWYPTMRLFRQPAPGAWADVVARVGAALAARVAQPRATGER